MASAKQLERNASKDADEAAASKEARTLGDGEDGVSSTEDGGMEDDEAPKWAKKMGKDMTRVLHGMKRLNVKVDDAVNTAREAKTAVEDLKGNVETLRTDYTAFKVEVGDIVRKEVDKAMSEKVNTFGGEDPDIDRPDRLVIVTGWPEGTSEEAIIFRLKQFIEDNALTERVLQTFCYDDPAMSAVMKFRSAAAVNAFLKGSRRMKNKELDGDRHMKFSRKLTLIERAAEKRLGYIKHAIMEKFSVGVKDVKIKWRSQKVEYNRVTVFKVGDQGERTYHGDGKDVSKEVEEKVKAWLEKRQFEGSD